MRINKPSLVVPALDHERVFAEDMGLATPRTIGRRSLDLTKEKVQGGAPPVVYGTHADGTAADSLLAVLQDTGVIIDQTTAGMIKPEAAPTESPVFTGQIQVIGYPPAAITWISNTFMITGEIDPDNTTYPATIAATPVGTYPGAGTSPTGVSVTGGNLSGQFQLTTGTTPAAGDICRVSFGINRLQTGYAVLFPRSNTAAAESTKIKIGAQDATGFTVTAVSGVAAGNPLIWNYVVL